MTSFLFFFFAGVAIASSLLMIMHRSAVYSALFLIVTLFATAGLFVLLNAPFIAAVHIIVYAGAIMVLFLFILMLLNQEPSQTSPKKIRISQVAGILLAGILFVELVFFIQSGSIPELSSVLSKTEIFSGDTQSIGRLLFTKYLFPFEIASVLLLSAIIGSVILAKPKIKS